MLYNSGSNREVVGSCLYSSDYSRADALISDIRFDLVLGYADINTHITTHDTDAVSLFDRTYQTYSIEKTKRLETQSQNKYIYHSNYGET